MESRDRHIKNRKRHQSMMPVLIAVILIIIVVLVGFGNSFFEEYGNTGKKADLNAYYGIAADGDAAVILNNEITDKKAVVKDGTAYIALDFANELDDTFYYDANEKLFLVTTANGTDKASGSDYFVDADTVYVSTDFVKKYVNLEAAVYTSPDRLVLRDKWEEENTAKLGKKTALRIGGSNKADVIEQLEKGSQVTVLSANEAYTYVSTTDGNIGYVATKRLESFSKITPTAVTGAAAADFPSLTETRKIVLGWHNVTNTDANAALDDVAAKAKGMNVISPTWFSMSDNNGNITSIASKDYVSKAHDLGLEVWGLVDNFSQDTDTNEVLSHTTTRQALENNIIAQAEQVGLDGVNIDFEKLKGETGDDFAQFLRELSLLCHQNKLILSVDNYVPKAYTQCYKRDVQAKVCDYVIIMGYDEHTSGSEEAGSVASMDFVMEGIQDTLQDVPADKVINAVPFYTRVWKEESGTLDSDAMGMADAATFLKDNGISAAWDDKSCQDYAQFDKNGITYKVWMEDAKSIEAKLQVMKTNDLAGVAAWKLGMETSDIWDVISRYYPSEASEAAK